MSAVSIPRGQSSSRGSRAIARAIAATLVGAFLAGASLVGPIQDSSHAAGASSALTVKWDGDATSAAAYQPERLPSSPHYSEFKNLTVTVSQTTGIIDQAIRVSIAGLATTQSSNQSGISAQNARNYVQAMQCWGPDPLAEDFNETCQWGGKALTAAGGLGESVIPDNALRVGPLDIDPFHPSTHDVPFRTADGQVISGKPFLENGVVRYEILDLFGPTTTNEVTSARIGAAGTGYFDFETQSSDQAPQLGCGTATHLRCWLVIVPRGTVFGGDGAECSGILDRANDYEPYSYGRANSVQGGSPINDNCDYFDNRIVIPLDFAPTGRRCDVGSSEVRVVGSQLMVGAMSSWQPALCSTVKSTFSFSTNPDSVARAQLIETTANTPNIIYSGYPVSSGELLTDFERTTLSKTKIFYAPVAISSVVLGFLAEDYAGRQEQLNLSPRLVAKLLTQSYVFTVPYNDSDPEKDLAHLPAVNRGYLFWNRDPEFQALNPSNYLRFDVNPAVVLPGPSGSDAIKQVWRWILADNDAVAFLNGDADPWGMTVNPYYLPKGHPNAVVPWWLDEANNFIGQTPVSRQVGLTNLDGSPQKLTDLSLDTFPKNDETLVPLVLNQERYRFDSIQSSPYTSDLLAGARQGFRANPNAKTVWDPNKISAGGEGGDWVSAGPQVPGAKFMLVITDSPSALRYGLNMAGIELPNSSTVVRSDEQTMARALAGLAPTSIDSVKQVNPAQVPSDGYPMTIVTYAGVNVTKATVAARGTIAAMLKQVTTTGQVSGSGTGELPAGYLPLTTELTTQANTAATAILTYTPPTTTTTNAAGGYAQDGSLDSFDALADDTGVGPSTTGGVDEISSDRTPVSSIQPIVGSALLIALGIGLLGFLVAPILFRGRGFL